jgi:hypothetical protein
MRMGARAPRGDDLAFSVPVKVSQSGLNLLDARLLGDPVLAFLDTGSTTTVGNKALMDLAIRSRSVSRDWADIELSSVTGQTMSGRLAALRRFRLGKMTLLNVPVVFGPIHTFEYWGLNDRPAILIGNDVLSIFDSVALDFNRGNVQFQMRSSSAKRTSRLS